MPNTREMMKKDAKKKKSLNDKMEEFTAMYNPFYNSIGKIGDSVEKLEKLENKVKKGEKVSAGEVIDIATDMTPVTRMIKDTVKEVKDLIDGKNILENRVESVRKVQKRLPWNKANQGR